MRKKPLSKGLERMIRRTFIKGVGRVFPAPPLHQDEARELLLRGEIRKILFIGTYQGLGQLLCATPVFRAFKDRHPQASLHFLGNPVNLLVARANPCLEKVWAWDKTELCRPWKAAGLINALRRERFDMAIILSTEMVSTTALILARLSGTRRVVGYLPKDGRSEELHALYHLPIPYVHETREVDRFLGLARALGIHPATRDPEFNVSGESKIRAREFLESKRLSDKRPLVGLFLGGKPQRPERLWPAERFSKLAEGLYRSGVKGIVAISPPGDPDLGRTFRSGEDHRLVEFQKTASVPHALFQKPDLEDVAALLQELDLLVCPDGGVMHLAAAVGTPTVALFFDTDPLVWHHPSKTQHALPFSGAPSSSLQPEVVLREALKILQIPS